MAQTQTAPAQTQAEIVAALRAENAKSNSAVWNAVKRVPGLLAGAGVDTANLLLGALAGRGLQGLSKKPVGGSESINEAFGLKKSDNATQNAVEGVLGMMSPGGAAGAASKAMLLMHGGLKPIIKPNAELVPNVDYQAVFGPGFYTTNELLTPFKSAMKSSKNTGGTISVFDLPDEQYAATLKLSTEPISKQPQVSETLGRLVQADPAVRDRIIELAKFRRQGTGQSLDQTITGELVEDALRQMYGRDQTYLKLAEYGIPGRTWQYSASSPEQATLVFTPAYSQLKPVGQFSVTPGTEGYKVAQQQLQRLLTGSDTISKP
jgi:hypothetical protein